MKRLTWIKTLLAALLLGWGMIVLPVLAQTDAEKQNCSNFYSQFKWSGGDALAGVPQFCSAAQVIGFVINLLLQFSGLVAVVFLMLGGFWYLTAAGNEEQAEKGRKALTSAVIGLVVIVMAYALVRITVNILTNGVAGGTTTTTGPSSGSTGTTGTTSGTGGTANPASTNPGAAAGSPLSSDPSNIYSQITQQDVSDYNSEVLGSTILVNQTDTGITFTSNVSGSNKAAIAEMWIGCNHNQPDFEYMNGNNTGQAGHAPYTLSGTNTWVASARYDGAPQSSDSFTFFICQHQINYGPYIPTSPLR